MSGYRNRTLQRVDSTAKALIDEAQAMGAQYLGINGVIDGVLFWRNKTLLIDWKGSKTPLTVTQQKLIDAGWPIHFVRTSKQLQDLLRRFA